MNIVSKKSTRIQFISLMITIIFLFDILPIISSHVGAESDDILTLYPIADSDIKQRVPDECFGDSTEMLVSTRYGGLFRTKWQANILIKFDFSSIKSETLISSATLYLFYNSYYDTNPAGRQLTCYRVKNSWDENTVTWNNRPNLESAPLSYAKVPSSPKTWVMLDVTTDVQSFIEGDILNYGWWIMDNDLWLYRDIPQHIYRSRESDYSPYLKVTCTGDGIENNPPNTPSNPCPANNSMDISSKGTITLQWDGTDPDIDDSVTYEIYFEKNNPQPDSCISENQSNNFIDVEQLDYAASYYWYVVSWDSHQQSSSSPVWSFSTEERLNSPPDKPTIKGPQKGKNYQDFSFTFSCTDPENNSIKFFIDWGDGNTEKSSYISSDADFIMDHYWVKPGTYNVRVYSIDDAEYGFSSSSEMVEYEVKIGKEIMGIGYILDMDDDGIFDTFHNDQLGIDNNINMLEKDIYEIDIDNDSIFDYLYSSSTDKLESIVEKKSINILWYSSIGMMILVFSIGIFFLYRKGAKNKQKETVQEGASIVVNGNSTVQRCCVCLGRMKGEYSVVKCYCGKLFHKSCIERIGKCPNCSRIYTKESNEKD